MNYVYASLLLHSAGKPINEENVKKVVSSTGEQPDDAKIKVLVAALDGVNIDEVISKAAMPVAVASTPVSAASVETKKDEGPSEEEVEKKAEEAAGGLAALFG